MADERTPYANILLEMWVDIIRTRQRFREAQVSGDAGTSIQDEYISKITSLWVELYPIVVGNPKMEEFRDEFKKYERFYFDPRQLIEGIKESIPRNDDSGAIDTTIIDIYRMEITMRRILDKLAITPIV